MPAFHLDRRDFLRTVVSGAAGLSISRFSFAQQAPPAIKATKLSDRVVLLTGDGGNVAVILSDDGLLMIDGGVPERAADLQKAVKDVDSHPVRILYNTHWHFDHVGSNELLGKSGAKIIGHDNVKKWLSTKVTMEAMNRTFEPLAPEGRPTETFSKNGKMTFGKEKLEYMHVAPAHTDSDSYVFLPEANVLHCGDAFFNGFYPVIDYSTGGWVGGMAAAAETFLKIGDAKTQIVPGHGPMGTKEDLKRTHDMLASVSERMVSMAKDGKSVDEVVAAAPTKDFDDKFGKGMFQPAAWTKIAYTSVLRHNQKA